MSDDTSTNDASNDDGNDDDGAAADTGAGGSKDKDAELQRWKALARKHERDAQAAAKKIRDFEDAGKSELERAQQKAAQAEQRAADAETMALRIEVALDAAPEGMSVAQIRKLAKRLTGSTREEIETDAAELFSDFGPTPNGDNGNDGDGSNDGGNGSSSSGPPRSRPAERLRPGAGSEPEVEPSTADVLAKIPRL